MVMDLNVQVAGTRCDVSFAGARIHFLADGREISETAATLAALWVVLPLAMQRGLNIRIRHPIDPLAVENARHLVNIWSRWAPEEFRWIDIVAEELTAQATAATSRLYFFSGGLDSHSMLVRTGSFSPHDHALTILGLDYKEGDSKFQDLLRKTDPTLTAFGLGRLIVRTNAARVLRNLRLNHGFVLASAGFLLSDRFASCHLSADGNSEDEFLVFPWGTNSVTNKLFKASGYSLITECLDEGRSAKISRMMKNPSFLPNLTFCSDSRFRPDNCGVCGKCVRTKLSFLVMAGRVPEIFVKNGYDEASIDKLNFRDRVIFESLISLVQESGPDFDNPVVRAIKAKLDQEAHRRSKVRRWGSLLGWS